MFSFGDVRLLFLISEHEDDCIYNFQNDLEPNYCISVIGTGLINDNNYINDRTL